MFEDLMMIVTEGKVKLISHLQGEHQYAEEDVLDFREFMISGISSNL